MENFVLNDIRFEDNNLMGLLTTLKSLYCDKQTNFAQMCFTIYSICDYCKNNYYKAKNNELYNSHKLLEKFGFDKNSISRYKLCYERYCQGTTFETVVLKQYYYYFTPSKLFEMLSLSYNTLENAIDNKIIKPEMTVKQIREYIKHLKDGTDKADKVLEDNSSVEIKEEEIPLAYNPTQEYEYSYFETKTKNQLLNIVWQLQKEYQKLKKKEKRKNEHK